MGGRGSTSKSAAVGSLDYQGNNMGSGKAFAQSTLTELKGKMGALAEKTLMDEAAAETRQQLAELTSEEDYITIYRGTPGDAINNSDWVFMSLEQAENWCRSRFSGAVKPGYHVVTARVKAKDVGWTGKNLEFVYLGDSGIGETKEVQPRKKGR